MMRYGVLAAMVLLSGCNKPVGDGSGNSSGGLQSAFDTGFRKTFREKFIAQCTDGAKTASHTTLDFTAVCTCSADKLLAAKSATELMSDPTKDPESQAILATCAKEHPPT